MAFVYFLCVNYEELFLKNRQNSVKSSERRFSGSREEYLEMFKNIK